MYNILSIHGQDVDIMWNWCNNSANRVEGVKYYVNIDLNINRFNVLH